MMIDPVAERTPVSRALIVMAAFVVVVAGLRAAQAIVTPVLLATFLAIIVSPALAWLGRKRVPRWLALLIVVGVSVLVILGLVGLIGRSLTDFYRQLPEYTERLGKQAQHLATWLKDHGVDVEEATALDRFDPKRLTDLAGTVLGTLGSLTSDVVVVLLIFGFMLVEVSGLREKLQAMPGYSSADEARLGQILDDVRHYLAIKTQVSLATGVLVTIWLWILGVDYAILWGLLAFFFNYVPNIGSVIAAIPPVLLALVQLGPAQALYVGLGYLVVEGVIGSLIEPRLMGQGLGLSTLVVFLSLLFWGWVLGPVGMILSVPLTIIARIALERSDDTRWIAILLAARPPEQAMQPAKRRR